MRRSELNGVRCGRFLNSPSSIGVISITWLKWSQCYCSNSKSRIWDSKRSCCYCIWKSRISIQSNSKRSSCFLLIWSSDWLECDCAWWTRAEGESRCVLASCNSDGVGRVDLWVHISWENCWYSWCRLEVACTWIWGRRCWLNRNIRWEDYFYPAILLGRYREIDRQS